MEDLSAFSAKPRLRLLLDHFAKIKDARQSSAILKVRIFWIPKSAEK
jgi:hypothetical protein